MTDQHAYVHAVLALCRGLPDTTVRPRPLDRRLAADWHRRGVPLGVIEAALLLTTARRQARDPEAPSLPPVRSLHYYQPVVEELLANVHPDRYLSYLRDRLPTARSAVRATAGLSDLRSRRLAHQDRHQRQLPFDPGALSKNDVSR